MTSPHVWATMTPLTQEVKLQGRSFKKLNDTLSSQASRLAERERKLPRETERRCRTEILGVLMDMRDRLKRGLKALRARRSTPETWSGHWNSPLRRKASKARKAGRRYGCSARG